MGTLNKALLALALAATATGPALARPAHDTLEPGARYVAMGSSFAAGAGIAPTKPGTPARCARTDANYASLLATRLGLSLDDQTCGGATTAHVLGPWNELPPQIAAVNAETRLVTVTIGGNDVNYARNLVAASCAATGGTMVMLGQTIPCFAPQAPTEADYARLEQNLGEIAREVARRAPHARMVFVQYVKLVPDRLCAETPSSPEAAAANREIGRRLAETTARAARANGALVLPVDRLSRRHTACDAQSWSRGMPAGYDGKAGGPWHPTLAGHAAIADALARLLGSRGR